MKYINNILLAASMAFMTASCVDEIEDGTTDIDSWELPKVEVSIPEHFVHPGVIFNAQDQARWRDIVLTQHAPQYQCFEAFAKDRYSSADYVMQGPFESVRYGQSGENNQLALNGDWAAACQNAIMFVTTGEKKHADKAMEIIRAYAHGMTKRATFTSGGGQLDYILTISNCGVKMIYAAEIMRYAENTPMTDADFNDLCEMLEKTFIPDLEGFFDITEPTRMAIGNFGATAMNCYASMAIFMDRVDRYKYAIDRYLNGYDNGSIRRYVMEGTGQCQESGRDQTHCQLGLGMCSMLCENAWKQGTDIYSAYDNRLLLGYEYTANYNNGGNPPFTYFPQLNPGAAYQWYEPDQQDKEMFNNGQRDNLRRGLLFPIYERVYNHYVVRKGLSMPYSKAIMDKMGMETLGYNDVAHLGYGTFLYNTEGYPAN